MSVYRAHVTTVVSVWMSLTGTPVCVWLGTVEISVNSTQTSVNPNHA